MSTGDPDVPEENLVPPSTSVVFEASTQTPTNETCDSLLYTQKGYCLKTSGHSYHALTNIHRMRQNGQVSTFSYLKNYILLLILIYFLQ